MKHYWIARLREPSTWLGMLQFCTAFGFVEFTPEQNEAVTAMIMIVAGAGVVGMVVPDKQHDNG